MGSISIKKKYLSKIQQLKKHNQLYYEKSTPKISDKEFDILKKEILELEKKYDFLKDKESPSISVGYKPSKNFVKFKHRVQMLSLSNAIDKEDLQNFEKRIFNFLNLNKNNIIEYSVEPKIDGISASLTYKNRKLVTGLSRGNGTEGEIITENLKTVSDIPKKINREKIVTILGNLLENALEAAQENTSGKRTVLLSMTDFGNDLIFEVEDSGSGIEDESVDLSLQHGFTTKSGTGRGIGLSLVHENLKYLGGHLTVVRSSLGGMRFTIYIPKHSN